MRLLRELLGIGHRDSMSESLARHLRVANAISLVGVALAVASIPFDLLTVPRLFVLLDLAAIAAFASCWVLNAAGHPTVARVMMLVLVNLVLGISATLLGEQSRQHAVFFGMAVIPFLVFDLDELRFIVPTVALAIVVYFVSQELDPLFHYEYALEAYRIYSPVLAFGGVIAAAAVAARVNHRAAAAVRDARARAVASARMAALGEMASGIAHEIRNPLTAITLAAEQIATATSVDSATKLAPRVERMTGRISKIVDALSSFARDASADPFALVPVQRILAETFELCQRRFVAHGIELTVVEVAPSLEVECRPVQISQIVLNLLNNAHDAVAEAPTRWVRVEVSTTAADLEIAVVDSGPGIPRELRTRIFEPFFTSKGPSRGTGLGLSLSRGLAEAHHGTLELDVGAPHTRFVLRIPLRQPRAA